MNDGTSVDSIVAASPCGILFTPGPGTPDDARITLAVVARLSGTVPILGVCLGHQSIGQAFGGRVIRVGHLMHGKTSLVVHDGKTISRDLPNPFRATRYHSLVAEEATLPDCLEITAKAPEGELMGIRHRALPVEGVQFHPQSILTEHGLKLIGNWLEVL